MKDNGFLNMMFPSDRYQIPLYGSMVLMVLTFYHLLYKLFKNLISLPLSASQIVLPITFNFLHKNVNNFI